MIVPCKSHCVRKSRAYLAEVEYSFRVDFVHEVKIRGVDVFSLNASLASDAFKQGQDLNLSNVSTIVERKHTFGLKHTCSLDEDVDAPKSRVGKHT